MSVCGSGMLLTQTQRWSVLVPPFFVLPSPQRQWEKYRIDCRNSLVKHSGGTSPTWCFDSKNIPWLLSWHFLIYANYYLLLDSVIFLIQHLSSKSAHEPYHSAICELKLMLFKWKITSSKSLKISWMSQKPPTEEETPAQVENQKS